MSIRDRVNQMALTCADQIVALVNEFAAVHRSKMTTHDLALYPPEYQHNPQSGLHRARVRAALVPKPDTKETPASPATPNLDSLNAQLLHTPPGQDPRSLQGMVAAPTPATPSSPENAFGNPPPFVLPSWDDVIAKYPALEVYMDFGVVDPTQVALAAFNVRTNDDTPPEPGTRTPFNQTATPKQAVPWSDHANATPIADLLAVQRLFQRSANATPDVARVSQENVDHARRTREVTYLHFCNLPPLSKFHDEPYAAIDPQEFFDLVKTKTDMAVVIDDTLTDGIRVELSPEAQAKANTIAPMVPPKLTGVIPKPAASLTATANATTTCTLCGNRMLPHVTPHYNTPLLRCTGCGETKFATVSATPSPENASNP